MSDIIEFPGAGLASKKVGRALIAATLNHVSAPLSVAGECSEELRGRPPLKKPVLLPIDNLVLHHGNLSAAQFNHARMLSRAALVRATNVALWKVAYPHMVATPTLSAGTALAMVSVLFRGVGKPKNVETAALISACVDTFAPASDAIGKATGLWKPVSIHPVVLALAVRQLVNTAVFTSIAELRTAMLDAQRSIIQLYRDTDRWLELLRVSDRVMFEFDRASWDLAYSNVGADVVCEMQDPSEAGDEDEDGTAPASPRWSALEAMRAKIEGD